MADKTKAELLAEYEVLEDAIEKSAIEETWDLADWLAETVPNQGITGRPKSGVAARLVLADLAAAGRRSEDRLRKMRQMADEFGDRRIPGVSVETHMAAYRANGSDVGKALEALTSTSTLRDVDTDRDARVARRVMSTPEGRAKVLPKLEHEAIQETASDAHKAAMDDLQDRKDKARKTADPAISRMRDSLDRTIDNLHDQKIQIRWHSFVLQIRQDTRRIRQRDISDNLTDQLRHEANEMREALGDALAALEAEKVVVPDAPPADL